MKMNGITTSFRRGRLARNALAALVVAIIFFAVPTAAQESVLDRLIQRTRSGKSSAASASPGADTETLEPTATSNTDPVRGLKTSQTKIPMAGPQQNDKIKVESQDGLISIVVRDAPLSEVLDLLAHEKGLNLVTAENIKANVSVNLNRVKLTDALDTVLAVAGYTWVRDNDIIIVTSLTGTSKLAPHTQGRVIRVFRLDYVAARDVSTVIAGFLSPAGQSFLSQTTTQDNRKTQDVVVVEDVPSVVERVAQYIGQVDVPPRQVLIEARILQVTLRDNYVNGVNLLIDELSSQTFGRDFRIDMKGFANPGASPAFFFTLSRQDLKALVELLETTTDAKNLASPKVLVVNGQEAHFQVGQRIGFKQVTTTETSSQESIGFLDVGVQLRVRPYISGDANVLMHVKPEVSSGRINPETGAPDAEIIQVDTDVLLPDGRGMVIGGLIQEEDSTLQSKVPVLGNLWLVGRIFQRRQVNKERKEVVIVLIPSIVPHATVPPPEHEQDVQRSLTPLFEGQLNRVSRPWEPRMPDAVENPVLLRESVPKVRLLRLSVPSNTHFKQFDHPDVSINSDCPVQPMQGEPDSPDRPSNPERVEVLDPVNPNHNRGDPAPRVDE